MASPAVVDRTGTGEGKDHDYEASKKSRFRFKSNKKRRDDAIDAHSGSRSPKVRGTRQHSYDHRSRQRRKRRKVSHLPPDDPSTYDDTYLPHASSGNYVSPDEAFRESLFDALGDDEGAAFWEGVYGQPIHTYPSVRQGLDGELERMTDEEYTAYVRAKMWEKSHEHIIEERARIAEDKARRKMLREEEKRMREERGGFQKSVEESLKRGSERRFKKHWKEVWEAYMQNWEDLKSLVAEKKNNQDGVPREKKTGDTLRNKIFWPVESGKLTDISKEEVENFMRNASSTSSTIENEGGQFLNTLKMERVRWHPDKIQQRYVGLGNEEGTMKAVTAVFQIIDLMWAEERQNQDKDS